MSLRVERLSRQLCGGGEKQASMAHKSPLTTHVLNTATGKPAAGLKLRLARKVGEDVEGNLQLEPVSTAETNDDGRVSSPLLDKIEAGQVYEIHFDTREYFASRGEKCFYPFVKIVFEIEDPQSHYHVPLLISPYGYSTYRGS